MPELILLLIPVPLVAFWFWMFRDMMNNPYLPGKSNTPFTWPPTTKNDWFLAFFIFSIFAAIWYYLVEYRNRRL